MDTSSDVGDGVIGVSVEEESRLVGWNNYGKAGKSVSNGRSRLQ